MISESVYNQNERRLSIMIVEKFRSDSLLPGSSVLSLIKTRPLLSSMDEKIIPIITAKGQCLGYVDDRFLALLRGSRHFSYTKYEKVKVLQIKSKDTDAALRFFAQDLKKRGLHSAELGELVSCFTSDNDVFQIERSLMPMMGAKQSRLIVFGFVGRDRNCQLWMGKRTPVAVREPTLLQNIISFDLNAQLFMSREVLSEVTYKAIGLQPALYRNLRSAGIQTSMIKIPKGVSRISTQAYELDLTDFPTFTPSATSPVESYELVPVKTVLDWCHAKVICENDIFPIISFAIRHGIITPETDENYVELCQAMQTEAASPFLFRK